MILKLFAAILFFCFYGVAKAQECTSPGQTPSTAFPVCGTTVFKQTNVPICGSHDLYVPGCTGTDGALYANKNPYWYKFTCFTSGTLGFEITPNDVSDDYDWQLYDVTGLNPDEVLTNKKIIVTGNWAGNPGTTGTSSGGLNYIQCASPYNGNESRFAKMPILIAGHQYILLVSHFTDSQSGYSLSFGGGTAVITDPKNPDLDSISASCDGKKIFIKLNKRMKCSSLAADGSDFSLSAPGIKIISAQSFCSGFDMDSLVLELNNLLPVGNYTVTVKKGSDGNTLIDNCDNAIPEGNSLPLKIEPLIPVPMDSIAPVMCAPQSLQLVFSKNISCNSIAADGSDFTVDGPVPVKVVGAKGDCNNEFTRSIFVTLDQALVNGGIYTIRLKQGGDGNTLLDECSQPTPAGSFLRFPVKDTVSAAFTYEVLEGCRTNEVRFLHNGAHGVNQWLWQLDYDGKSNLQNPVAYFDPNGKKKVILKVSNGVCTDSTSQIITFDNALKASFEISNIICPEDSAQIKNTSLGHISAYEWNFGNGNTSTNENPFSQKYPDVFSEKSYRVSLIVKNQIGCSDTAVNTVKVLKSCYLAVPNAFTPNGDGINDFFYPLNAFKADQLRFRVYNRLGQLVYHSEDWQQKWDGTINGNPQDSGIYVWTLEYISRDTGKRVFAKGSAMLIR